MKTLHTATPWELDVPNSHLIAKKVNGIYQYIANCDTTMYDESRGGDDIANAAYIVKCVNSHEQLVEALKLVKCCIVCNDDLSISYAIDKNTHNAINAALKLVEGVSND